MHRELLHAFKAALFKPDTERRIDRVIDYFGEPRRRTAVTRTLPRGSRATAARTLPRAVVNE
jgi:hypothetical protein